MSPASEHYPGFYLNFNKDLLTAAKAQGINELQCALPAMTVKPQSITQGIEVSIVKGAIPYKPSKAQIYRSGKGTELIANIQNKDNK